MASGHVEVWLGKLLAEALRALHGVVRNAAVAINDPSFELIQFENSFPAQVSVYSCSAVNQLRCAGTEDKERTLIWCTYITCA